MNILKCRSSANHMKVSKLTPNKDLGNEIFELLLIISMCGIMSYFYSSVVF